MNKTKVIFLCTGNSARSQMAEAFLRKYGDEHFEVYSAGFEPKPIHPLTVKVMNEVGIDMSGHTSKDLKQFLGKTHFGIIITVCSRAEEKCPTFPGVSTRLHWPFDDPAAASGSQEEQLSKFREVRDQIEAKIKSWLKERGIAQAAD
ncbi:MAG: arsenate reductase ArsC [Candidatus Bathyarchaeota archaeon]|nr:arsenate reductase ArsC [Candidatus Bathyarchaeota archaeon]